MPNFHCAIEDISISMFLRFAELHDLVTVYKLGRRLDYTVPNFPVFTAVMKEAVYQRVFSVNSNCTRAS